VFRLARLRPLGFPWPRSLRVRFPGPFSVHPLIRAPATPKRPAVAGARQRSVISSHLRTGNIGP
jgi:hypothetical protein